VKRLHKTAAFPSRRDGRRDGATRGRDAGRGRCAGIRRALAWPGTVVDATFRGSRRSLAVEAAGRRFIVDCPATRATSLGDAVTLQVDADSAWALKA
jgi:hypothetical protein